MNIIGLVSGESLAYLKSLSLQPLTNPLFT